MCFSEVFSFFLQIDVKKSLFLKIKIHITLEGILDAQLSCVSRYGLSEHLSVQNKIYSKPDGT